MSIELLRMAGTYGRRLEAIVREDPWFQGNPELIGAFAEQTVRQWVADIVAPLRVSSGAIIAGRDDVPHRKHDVIIWSPNPLPPLVSAGDFAVVPSDSVLAVMEIKKDGGTRALGDIEERAAEAPEWMPRPPAFLGIICWRKSASRLRPGTRLHRLQDDHRAVWILEGSLKKGLRVNVENLCGLFNFLAVARQRYFSQTGRTLVVAPNDTWVGAYSVSFPESIRAHLRLAPDGLTEIVPYEFGQGDFILNVRDGGGSIDPDEARKRRR